jgi:hypothetical protein
LQADWQEVWHSPQPLPAAVFNVGFAMVLMCFMAFLPYFFARRGIGPAVSAAGFVRPPADEPQRILYPRARRIASDASKKKSQKKKKRKEKRLLFKGRLG